MTGAAQRMLQGHQEVHLSDIVLPLTRISPKQKVQASIRTTAPLRASTRRTRLHVTAAVKTNSGKQVVCSKTLVAKKGKEEQVRKLCGKVLEFGVAQAADRKNGIMEYQCVKDGWEDNVFHFYERFDSNVSMGRYNSTETVTEFMKKARLLL
eukprot:gene20314-27070_t